MATSDFNGDGRDDILWRHTSGLLSNWLGTQSGGFIVNDANALVGVPTDWRVLGTGDFDGDGSADILWQNTNGDVSSWLGSSGGWQINDAAAYVRAVDPTWYILGIGDFNDDGRDDLIWASEDIPGRRIWFAEPDGGFGTPVLIGTFGDPWFQWHWATHVGDFNGDGRHDLLFTDDGAMYKTSLATSGGTFANAIVTPRASQDWQVIQIGDSDGDGNDDLLWRNHRTGAVSNWLATGDGDFVINDANAYHQVDGSWNIFASGDYNGDGNADLLWRQDSGVISTWLGTDSGGFIINDVNAWTPVGLDWGIVRAPVDIGASPWDY